MKTPKRFELNVSSFFCQIIVIEKEKFLHHKISKEKSGLSVERFSHSLRNSEDRPDFFIHPSKNDSKSGRKRWVRSNDCWNSHSLILASCPESNTSGTFHPLYSAGRV